MKKIIAILMVLIILAPVSVMANSGSAAAPSPFPQMNIFNALRDFSSKINLFLIPNYIGSSYGLLAEAENKLSEAARAANQLLGNAVPELKNKSQYAIDSLVKLRDYIFSKNSAGDAINGAKNAAIDQLHILPSPINSSL